MSAARFSSQQRRVGNEKRSLYHVGFFGCALGQSRIDLLQFSESKSQSFGAAVDAAVIPHHLPDRIGGDLCRAAIAQNGYFPGLLTRYRGKFFRVDHVARDALREHQSLEQRVRRETIGAMDARPGNLSARVKPVQARSSPQIGDDAPHHVMRSWSHRYQIFRWIDSAGAADGEDSGESL